MFKVTKVTKSVVGPRQNARVARLSPHRATPQSSMGQLIFSVVAHSSFTPHHPIMSASTRIPPIAQPFVSERAKKTLDLVTSPLSPLSHTIVATHLCPGISGFDIRSQANTSLSTRSRSSSRRIVSPAMLSSLPSWAKARSDGKPPPSSWSS